MTENEKSEAKFKAWEIKQNLNQYNIPESVDRNAIAKDIVTEILNDLNAWGVNDWSRGNRIEFWEEVERNL